MTREQKLEVSIDRSDRPSNTLIYKRPASRKLRSLSRRGAKIVYWQPGISRVKPPGKRMKYCVYSFYHWLRVFRNSDYGALFVLESDELKASMLIVPAHYHWPFMQHDDIQFTYVKTEPSAQKSGWGEYLLHQGISQFKHTGKRIWYVTSSSNIASQRLAEKTGFELVGTAEPRRFRWSRLKLSKEGLE